MEQVPDTFPWMFLGYAALWGTMVIYLLSLAARLRGLERETERRAQNGLSQDRSAQDNRGQVKDAQ